VTVFYVVVLILLVLAVAGLFVWVLALAERVGYLERRNDANERHLARVLNAQLRMYRSGDPT